MSSPSSSPAPRFRLPRRGVPIASSSFSAASSAPSTPYPPSIDNATSSAFRLPRRGIVVASSSAIASSSADDIPHPRPPSPSSSSSFSASTDPYPKTSTDPRFPRSLYPTAILPTRSSSTLLALVRCITNSIDNLTQCYNFTNTPSMGLSSYSAETTEFIGRGKTFNVSRIPLPAHLTIQNSWPKRLVVAEAQNLVDGPRGYITDAITCKRPLIELDVFGNLKDGADKQALKAVILEVQVLTHSPLYLHRNIVDFLGVSWQCESRWFQPGVEKIGAPRLVPAILIEYARHGNLQEFRKTEEYKSLGFDGRLKLCRDVAEGLYVLHKCGIVHGDVKLGNVLVFDDNRGGVVAKLADFGFSVGGEIKASESMMVRTDDEEFGWRLESRPLDKESAMRKRWKLKGRTWPWNDPEWQKPRDWKQMMKTDVFSYGLLVWAILSGEELGTLFDIRPGDTNNPRVREMVEGMKDWTLSFNAAEYFKESDEEVKLLLQCLFHCALDARVESRGLMKDIVNIWNTWFIDSPPYKPYPSDKRPPMMGPVETAENINLETVISLTSDSPPSVKQQLNNLYLDPSLSISERCDATLLRGFSHLIGWGVPEDLEAGKRFIDKAADILMNAAVFQPMFFDYHKFCHTPEKEFSNYKRAVLNSLMDVIQSTGAHEAMHQLVRHYPIVLDVTYRRWKCLIFRRRRYQTSIDDYPKSFSNEGSAELRAEQWEDIHRNFSKVPTRVNHNILHYAVTSGFTEVIQEILAAEDFDDTLLHQQDMNGDTPLMIAFRLGALAIAELLIEAGSDVRTRNMYGESLLHFLDEFQDPQEQSEIAELVLALGAKDLINESCINRSLPEETITGRPNSWGPPLVAPMMRGNVSLVKILLKHGANPNQGLHRTPMLQAAGGHFVEILELFWEACPIVPEMMVSRLLEAAIHSLPTFDLMYFHGVHGAKKAMERTIDFLLDKLGSTVMHGSIRVLDRVIKMGSADVLAHVLKRFGGSDINNYDQVGMTYLHKAIMFGGSVEKLKLLVEYGGDLTLETKYQHLLSTQQLVFFEWGGNVEIVRYLLGHGLGRNDLEGWGKAICHIIGHNNFEVAQILIDAGADIDTLDHMGWTTLGLVVRTCTYSSIDQLRFLIEHQIATGKKPAGFMVIPGEMKTALHVVAMIPHTSPFYDRAIMADVIDYLLDRFNTPEQLNAQDIYGMTALHYAARVGNPIFIQRLLEFEAIDITIVCHVSGQTALQYAVIQITEGPLKEAVALGGKRVEERLKADASEVISLLFKGMKLEGDGCTTMTYDRSNGTWTTYIFPEKPGLKLENITPSYLEEQWETGEWDERNRTWRGKEKEKNIYVDEDGWRNENLRTDTPSYLLADHTEGKKWKGKEKEKLDTDITVDQEGDVGDRNGRRTRSFRGMHFSEQM